MGGTTLERLVWRRRIGAGLLVLAAASSGGCATDWGVRQTPTLEDFGEGLLAVGAGVGAFVGFCALSEAGGGENMEYLLWPDYRWDGSRW